MNGLFTKIVLKGVTPCSPTTDPLGVECGLVLDGADDDLVDVLALLRTQLRAQHPRELGSSSIHLELRVHTWGQFRDNHNTSEDMHHNYKHDLGQSVIRFWDRFWDKNVC